MAPHSRRMELTTCFDFVSAGRYPYTGRLGILSAEDRQQVHRALELVGAAHLADRDFNRISDGQRQRILLARALCQQPEVILLDEPTSFLDIKGKIELLTILKELAHTSAGGDPEPARAGAGRKNSGHGGVRFARRCFRRADPGTGVSAGEHLHPVRPDRTAVHGSVRHTGAGSRKGTRRKTSV